MTKNEAFGLGALLAWVMGKQTKPNFRSFRALEELEADPMLDEPAAAVGCSSVTWLQTLGTFFFSHDVTGFPLDPNRGRVSRYWTIRGLYSGLTYGCSCPHRMPRQHWPGPYSFDIGCGAFM